MSRMNYQKKFRRGNSQTMLLNRNTDITRLEIKSMLLFNGSKRACLSRTRVPGLERVYIFAEHPYRETTIRKYHGGSRNATYIIS